MGRKIQAAKNRKIFVTCCAVAETCGCVTEIVDVRKPKIRF